MFETVADDSYVATDIFTLGGGGPYANASDLAPLSDGGFVAVWYDDGTVYRRVYGENGEFVTSTLFVDTGSEPNVAGLTNGQFIVTWTAEGPYPTSFDIVSQIFEADGTAVGYQFLANTTVLGFQVHSEVTALAGGGFVVTWEQSNDSSSDDIRGQVFAADGSKVGGEFVVTDSKPGDKLDHDIIALDDGGFVVGWFEWGAEVADSNGNLSPGSRAQLFDSAGNKIGAAFPLNNFVTGYQQEPVLAALPSGGFVAAYADNGTSPLQTETGHRGIWVQIFDENGQRIGQEIHASSLGPAGQDHPAITVVEGTGFLVTWRDVNSTDENEVGHLRAQLFDFNGNKIGEEFSVNPFLVGGQMMPDVISLSSGALVFAWTHLGTWDGDFSARMLFPATRGTTGNDTLTGTVNRDFIMGGDGNDTIAGGAQDDGLAGDAGTDAIQGGDGNDEIYGGSGTDALNGGSGQDLIAGETGVDTLTGGVGSDLFQDTTVGLNGDTITDFGVGDRIIITNATIGSFTYSLAGTTLNFTGGSLKLTASIEGILVASAVPGGGVQIVIAPTDARNDLNGDGRSDILWRHDNGAIFDFLGTSTGGVTNNGDNIYTVVDTAWRLAGTGDFNGDGRDDILWRHFDGAIFNFLGTANGGVLNNGDNSYMGLSANWTVAGVGDFNGDTRDDILFRDADGVIFNYLGTASGGFTDNSSNLFTDIGYGWYVAGVGDFNGDQRDDILLRNGSGAIFSFLGTADGGMINNGDNMYTDVSNVWHVAGIGDFNGDGRDDILWRHDNGAIFNFLGTATGGVANNGNSSYAAMSNTWQIQAIGDYNGDGRDDILWRDVNGTIIDWLGTAGGGFTDNSGNLFTSVALQWHVEPPMLGLI